MALSLLLSLAACGLITERGVYEGIRTQQHIDGAGKHAPPPPAPPYDQYKDERDKLKPPT
jgi:hypothetical protein